MLGLLFDSSIPKKFDDKGINIVNTKDEIIYYCNEVHPVGALLLTGEWGCGKTFLIEHDVKEALKDTHIIVRISLFGISSINELNIAIKKRWIDECAPFLKSLAGEGTDVVAKSVLSTLGSLAGQFAPIAKDISNAAISINPIDFIKIKPVVDNDKRVILVFDDLERSKLGTADILGCINEYSENQGFGVIVVANEKKIDQTNGSVDPKVVFNIGTIGNKQGSENTMLEPYEINICCGKDTDELSYSEIKEKVICRTIIYNPDHSNIIKNIVESDEITCKPEYRGLLKKNRDRIKDLYFYEVNIEKRDDIGGQVSDDIDHADVPQNIRSLKCAFRDFERVYDVLRVNEINDIEINEHLIAFIAVTLAVKADLLGTSKRMGRYDSLFSDDPLRWWYPGIKFGLLYGSEMEWAKKSIWDEIRLKKEIEERKEHEKTPMPKDQLKIARIMDLDDGILQIEFKPLLQEAYEGKLTLDEYVNLIYNSSSIRTYKLDVPCDIDWKQISRGIRRQIERLVSEDNREDYSYQMISDENRDKFTKQELEAYDLIKSCREGGISFERNRRNYLNALEEDSFRAFALSQNKRFDRFDEEMAKATIECFRKSAQCDKNTFPQYFCGAWGSLDHELLFKREETIKGFEYLEDALKELRSEYENQNKQIAIVSVDNLLKDVVRLKEKYKGPKFDYNE